MPILNFNTEPGSYRIERIIATEDLLRERVRQAKNIYDELLDMYEKEKTLRSGK